MKATPDVFKTSSVAAWSRILGACPDSRLLLKNAALGSADVRRFVHGLFADCGVPSARIELEGPAEHRAFLERYAAIDVALDTFPYSGGTTTMEALWQGVPVLTFPGDRWAARISASLLRNANLSEYVAPDLESYVARASALAQGGDTPTQLDELRRTMRERLRQAPVCDVRTFARNMELAYLSMWRRWHEADT